MRKRRRKSKKRNVREDKKEEEAEVAEVREGEEVDIEISLAELEVKLGFKLEISLDVKLY